MKHDAKKMPLDNGKGVVAPGSGAGLVNWDQARTSQITAKTHHQNVDFIIFEGMTMTGVNAIIISPGRIVYKGAGQ
jgi:dihydropyrimidinase